MMDNSKNYTQIVNTTSSDFPLVLWLFEQVMKLNDRQGYKVWTIGLTPEDECYDACYQGWTHYIQKSLKNYISTGGGRPNKSGAPQTETEKRLSNR